MQTCEIRILPEAEDFLSILPQTLVAEGYLSTYEAAERKEQNQGRILVKHITNN